MSIEPVRVVLGIANELNRLGMEELIMSSALMEVAGCSKTIDEAIEIASSNSSHIVVVTLEELDSFDPDMPLRPPAPKLVILVQDVDDPRLLDAAQVDWDGLLFLPELAVEVLEGTLRSVVAGRVSLPEVIARRLVAQVRARPPQPSGNLPVRMTPREQQVLDLMAQGYTNREIAVELLISQHGVKRLVANVLAKLHCPNRTSAVAHALAEGLVSFD